MSALGDCEECGGDAGRGECRCEDDGDSPAAGYERFAEWVEPGAMWCRGMPARRDGSKRRAQLRTENGEPTECEGREVVSSKS